jgi:hypothetical protein
MYGSWAPQGGGGGVPADLTGITSISFSPNPAGAGAIRLANNTGIFTRNAANTNDVRLAIVDGSNFLRFGGAGGAGITPATIEMHVASGGTFDLVMAAATEWSFSTTRLVGGVSSNSNDLGDTSTRFRSCFLGTSLELGTSNIASAGFIRSSNVFTANYRNAANSADLNLIKTDASDDITIGQNTAGNLVILDCADQGLRINNQVTGAGAGAGTLTNAPAAGNPTFWCPINVAGAVKYFPCW